MANRTQKMASAVKLLSKYHNLRGTEEMSRLQTFLEPLGGGGIGREARDMSNIGTPITIDEPIVQEILRLFIDTSDGCISTPNLCVEFNNKVEPRAGLDPSIRETFQRSFYIAYDTESANKLNADRDENKRIAKPIREMLGQVAPIINQNSNTPSTAAPAISIIESNTKRIALTQRYANACSLFLNGIPSIEIAKAVPYLNIEFNYPGSPFASNRQLSSPGLLKFLEGAKQKDETNTPFNRMAEGNATTVRASSLADDGSTEISDQPYSVGGMEMFTAPQTLVNANEYDNPEIRSNSILDKFKPFATIKQFEVNVAPSTGINSFKTAKLEFTLHDRSRLSEIADFIAPNLYGRNQMIIEYGWSHPGNENVYSDLINGMRIKETYGISNSSYTMDESGQIQVTLQLFTKGVSDLSTEVISTEDEEHGVASIIRQIRNLEETIGEIRQRVWPSDGRTREVRGIQILDIAQDALSNILLSRDARIKLKELQRQLSQSGRGANSVTMRQLQANLKSLFGLDGSTINSNPNADDPNGAGDVSIERLRRTVLGNIKKKIQTFRETPDPFYRNDYWGSSTMPPEDTRLAHDAPADNRARAEASETQIDIGRGKRHISLAKLLLHFIGVPLASTGKFEDIQMVYYPFNSQAGFASRINIAEFEVDLKYFVQELYRYRLDNLGRTSGMTLRDFITFIDQTLIGDPAARSYGMWDGSNINKNIYENGRRVGAGAVNDPPQAQARIETRLRGVTPNGSFRMPKIDFYIECLPEKLPERREIGPSLENVSNKNVLRIHIFDAQSTTYDTVGAIYASAQTNAIQTIGAPPASVTDVSTSDGREQARYIEAATRPGLGILELIPGTNPKTYRIAGGSRKLKEFIMETMPYIIYGCAGTLVKVANLSSLQNPALSTVNMLRSFRKTELQPNGELPGGLPMRIVPAELQISTFGCPLISYAQQFFVDFQTGTTADNIYAVVGISHKIADGDFSTDIHLVSPTDAYGVYENFSAGVRSAIDTLEEIEAHQPNRSFEQIH